MSDDWQTYREAGDQLGISAEAVRQRAIRGAWPRRRSNEGHVLVRVPEGVGRTNERPSDTRSTPGHHTDANALAVEVRLLREMLDAMRDERDHWRAMAERLSEPRKAHAGVGDILARMKARAAA